MSAAQSIVMVVDDDRDIREIVADVLGDAGYSVITAINGADAIELLAKVTPSLILLDLNMPVMDGFEFRRAQRGNPALAKIPTVIMSAVHRMKEKVEELAVDDTLEKPVVLKDLLGVVARFCRTRDTY
jgi:CheY-like chemotaxis protein